MSNVLTINALQQLEVEQSAEAFYDEIDFNFDGYPVENFTFNIDALGSLHIRYNNNNSQSITIINWEAFPAKTISFGSGDNKVSYTVEQVTETSGSGNSYSYIKLLGAEDVYTNYVVAEGAQDLAVSGLTKQIITMGSEADKVVLTQGVDNKISTNDGADNITVIGGSKNTIKGDAGNDWVTEISGTANTLAGGADNDILRAFSAKSATIAGGAGNDILTVYGGNSNVLAGNAGDDTYKVMTNIAADTQIVIDQQAAELADKDCLKLIKVAKEDVSFVLSGKDLQINHTNGGMVLIQDWYTSPLTKIVFNNGVLKLADIVDKAKAAALTNNTVTYAGSDAITVVTGNAMNIQERGDGTVETSLLINATTGVTGGLQLDEVYGAYTDASGDVTGNTVNMTQVVANTVKGGYTASGSASNNTVNLTNAYVQAGLHDDALIAGVMGGHTLVGNADGNIVTISGGEVNSINGGRGTTGSSNNKVIVKDDAVVEDLVQAGRSTGGTIANNTIEMSSGNAMWLAAARGKAQSDDVGLVASGNKVTMTGGSSNTAYAADVDYGTASENTVNITNAKVEYASGTRIRYGAGNATGNSVSVTDATVNYIYGAQVGNKGGTGNANSNSVSVTGSSAVTTTTGEYAFVESNTKRTVVKNDDGTYAVNVDNSETIVAATGAGVTGVSGSVSVNNVYGGYSYNGSADSNTVTLDKAVVRTQVTGGYTTGTGSANGNEVTLTDSYVGAGTYSDINSQNRVFAGYSAGGVANNNTLSITGGQVASARTAFGGKGSTGNTLTLNDTVVEGYAWSGRTNIGDATDNVVVATNTTALGITGGRVGTTDADGYKADNNSVTVTGGNVQYVTGGDTNRGVASNNTVVVDGAIAISVRGGRSRTVGDATGNKVTLQNGATAEYVYGGQVNNYGNATDNTVTIKNSTVTNCLAGGYSKYGSVYDNTVNIIDSTVTKVNVANAYDNSGYDNTVNISGNSTVTNVYGAEGKDYINISDTSVVTNLQANAGDDVLTITGGEVGNVSDEEITDTSAISMGAGQDQITISGGMSVLEAGADDDTITATGGLYYVKGGTGVDTFNISNSTDNTINGGTGSDKYNIAWTTGEQLTIENADYAEGDVDVFTVTGATSEDFDYSFTGSTLELREKATADQGDNQGVLRIKLATESLTGTANFTGITFADKTLSGAQIEATIDGSEDEEVVYTITAPTNEQKSITLAASDLGDATVLNISNNSDEKNDGINVKLEGTTLHINYFVGVYDTTGALVDDETRVIYISDYANSSLAAIKCPNDATATSQPSTTILVTSDTNINSLAANTKYAFIEKDVNLNITSAAGYNTLDFSTYASSSRERFETEVDGTSLKVKFYISENGSKVLYNTVTLNNYFDASGNVAGNYDQTMLRLRSQVTGSDIRGYLDYRTDAADSVTIDEVNLWHDGRKTLFTNGGEDSVVINSRRNYVDTGADNDTITINYRDNIVTAGSGDDTVIIGNQDTNASNIYGNKVNGGAGSDNITIYGSKNIVSADEGDDTITLSAGSNNKLYGYTGDDTFNIDGLIGADDSNNYIYGEDGNDTFNVKDCQTNTLTLNGGAGSDTYNIAWNAEWVDIRIAGADQNADGEQDTLNITGVTKDNLVFAYNESNDEMIIVKKNTCNTVLYEDWSTAAPSITIGGTAYTQADIEAVQGSYIAQIGSTDDPVDGTANGDYIRVRGGENVTVNGNDGDDIIRFQSQTLSDGTVVAGGNNEAFGGAGNDYIRINAGDNITAIGGAGNDRLRVQAGTGHDLYGGAGNDTYQIDATLGAGVSITVDQSDAGTSDSDVLKLNGVAKVDASYQLVGDVLTITDTTNGGNVIVDGWGSNFSTISFSDGSILNYSSLSSAFNQAASATLSFNDSTGAASDSLTYTVSGDDSNKLLTYSK